MPNPMVIRAGECKKFSPNIFNKTKCTNCFRQKEEHTAEALESNRASRKVAKCGYLFVAPGWDFTNPLNRTKRWQRRWFVLYDDGELSYSLDEHPETVPQACIDMNKVIDVSDAEELTGNSYSLAITTQDDVHFVKATCREEVRWWMDVLSVFPRSKGWHKRSTFINKNSTNNSIVQTTQTVPHSGTTNGDAVKEICTRYLWTENERNLTDSKKASYVSTRDKNLEKGVGDKKNYKSNYSNVLPNWDENKPSDVSCRLILDELDANDCKLKNHSSERISQSRRSSASFSSSYTGSTDIASHKQVRGDPDGCGLDLSTMRYSPTSELRVDNHVEDLLNIKKGWLMKQGGSSEQEWSKHWFVLRGSALLYYRDPTAEDQGILDGVIDLSVMNNIVQVQVARNYGFQINCWDERKYVLSAVTNGIRCNWISAIKRAAGIYEISEDKIDGDKEPPSTPRSLLLSSDEEYRTASEGGRRGSSSDWGETLPPSPPLNRTPISKVKERARGMTKTRIYNSKNSRTGTCLKSNIDLIKRQDILASCTDLTMHDSTTNERTTLIKRLDHQAFELEDVKRQLTSALRQLSSAEEELLRLRQRQQDVKAIEKQMADTLEALRAAEDKLKEKETQLSTFDSYKERYEDEKECWEEEIRVMENELRETENRYSEICSQLSCSRDNVNQLRQELTNVTERLSRGIEENESLYRRVRELEGRASTLSSMRESKGRSLDSLSDLTNVDFDIDFSHLDKERVVEEYEEVRARLGKAILEIRAMKKELRESHAQTDSLEINLINARQELKGKQDFYESQAAIMAARVQDLTGKLSAAEKNVRALKQKLSKTESREKRRSLSLKGRESFAICKELEDKLSVLEKKVASLDGNELPKPKIENEPPSNEKSLSRIRRKSLDSLTGGGPMSVLVRLTSLEAKVAKASSSKITINPSSDEIMNKKHRLIADLLTGKLREIYEKQSSLLKTGKLNDKEKLNLISEKIAYESLIVKNINDMSSENSSENLLENLNEILKNHILLKRNENDLKIENEENLGRKLENFINENIENLWNIVTQVELDEIINFAEKQICEKLINLEVTEILGVNVTNLIIDRGDLEKWADRAHLTISEYVKNAIDLIGKLQGKGKLKEKCRENGKFNENENSHENEFDGNVKLIENLCQYKKLSPEVKKAKINENKSNEKSSRNLSEKFDEKIATVEKFSDDVTLKLELETKELDKEIFTKFIELVAEKCLIETRSNEFGYLETEEDDKREKKELEDEEKKVFDSLDSVGSEIWMLQNSLMRMRNNNMDDSYERRMEESFSSFDSSRSSSWLDGVCRKCHEIKEQIINLQTCLSQGQECQKCVQLQQQLQRKELEYEEERKQLQNEHRQQILSVETKLEEEKNDLIKKHKEEELLLKEKSIKLSRRLGMLDSEYAQQIQNLTTANETARSMPFMEKNSYDQQAITKRYQTEIEHLKALCEKGLVAMDNSHKRIIAELQEKHKQEIESLKLEKEQALADETKATLAALDAMRKAHEAEVHKEVTKFQSEYLKKIRSSQDIEALHKEHQEEMDEIKKEILCLSEKYSIKCVESSALEEELRIANSNLEQAHSQIMQLDNRNKQLRAHLLSEVRAEDIQDDLLEELEEKNKQVEKLNDKISMHDEALDALCLHLNKGRLDQATLNSLLERLQLIALRHRASGMRTLNNQHVSISKSKYATDFHLESNGGALKSDKAKDYYHHMRSTSPCTINGMVAARKKMFEPYEKPI